MLVIFLTSSYLIGFSQQVEKDKIYFTSIEKTKGTFQLEVSEEKYCNTIITGEIMEQIEKSRHSSAITYLKISKSCRLKIFPFSMIEDLRKKPIEPCSIVKDLNTEN